MYHPVIVAAQQERLEAQFGLQLQRLPAAHCHAMRTSLDTIYDVETREPTRAFSQDEEAFILNEQLLVKIDYRYAAERYIWINYAGQSLRPMYPLWESQELILAELARVEYDHWTSGHPDGLLFNILKGRQLGACVEGNTKVLTADLRWVTVEELAVGTEVIATDEESPGGRGASRKLRTAVVEAKWDVLEPAFEVVLASGTSIVCSATHRWLYRTRTQTTVAWRAVADMKIGGYIRRITEPWGSSTLEDYWMGGMLDGEGSGGAKGSGGVEFCVSQVYGPVYDRAARYFRERGYASFHQDPPDLRTPETSSKFGRKPVGKMSVARMSEIFRLIGLTRPTRFLGRRWWEGKELPGKRTGGYGWDRVMVVRPLGRRRLFDLQTSTKTFIAEGLVSHNSTLVQSLLAHRVLTHGQVRTLVASDVPQNSGSEGLFGMLELVVEKWPWWLKPKELYHTKNRHIMWKNGSRVIVESGKSMKGGLQEEGGEKGQLGRSKTYSAVHLSEITTWERPEQINSSLLPAVPITPRTLMGRESTAMGRNNYWHQEWKKAGAGIDPRFFNIFVPFYAEKSKYWLPTPPGWSPTDDTLAFARRATEQGPQYMHRAVQLTREQLYWYEVMKAAAVHDDELYRFLSEYPSEPEEAFQNSGRSIFSVATMDRLEKQGRPLIDLWTVAPRAELIADREASLAEYKESQNQLIALGAKQRLRHASTTLDTNEPTTLREEVVATTEIEP
jgi:hypothetical protein